MLDKTPVVQNVFLSKVGVPNVPANPVNTCFLQPKSTEGMFTMEKGGILLLQKKFKFRQDVYAPIAHISFLDSKYAQCMFALSLYLLATFFRFSHTLFPPPPASQSTG